METIGITPASNEQNRWRKELYDKEDRVMRFDVVQNVLGTTLKEMKISKPCMLVWYIMSKGKYMFDRLMEKQRDSRVQEVWEIIHSLNGEFRKHIPIR